MARVIRLLTGIAASVLLSAAAATAAPLPSSVSSSRQLIVYGSEASLRGGICDLGERTKRTLLTVLQQRDDWKTPIVIYAQRRAANLPDAPATRLNVSQTGFGLKLQLELTFDPDATRDLVQRELIRVMLLEMMYRAAPDTPAGTPYINPPDWLVEGMLALMPESESAALAERVNALRGDAEVMQLEQFLRQRTELLESPLRAVFRAKAGAFVLMLCHLPDGQKRLARFIATFAGAPDDSLGVLRSQFSEIGRNPEDVQKSWARELAALGGRERYRMLSCDETERALAEALTLQVASNGNAPAETFSLEEYPEFVRSPAAPAALKALQQRLSVLYGTAHALYAPVISEYQRVAAALARRKTGKMTERLAMLRGDREEISRRMSAIDDYINWYEATQLRTSSGAFTDYMKAAEQSASRKRRHDAISVYLDALESHL
ncbi:MAG: hypothetical protein H0T11_04205 [Chthoniobacterales bacterium]|nr:hypothetical protein [Chthoniobacterales bacterium]